MKPSIERNQRLLELPLETAPRILLFSATLLLTAVFLFPLWKIRIAAATLSEPLSLAVYSYRLEAGNQGRDMHAIDSVNRSIGMKGLPSSEFAVFKWLPFAAGALALLFLRSAVLGRIGTLVDVLVLYLYFGVFSLWSFAYNLYSYGHDLAPTAAVPVRPFTPPLIGSHRIGEFEVSSSPAAASFALVAVAVVLAVALAISWHQGRQAEVADAGVAGG